MTSREEPSGDDPHDLVSIRVSPVSGGQLILWMDTRFRGSSRRLCEGLVEELMSSVVVV